MWSAVWAIAYKEYLQVFRSGAMRKHLTFQVAEFAMIAWINITVRNLPTVIVDRDQTTESRVLVERLQATQVFHMAFSTTSTEQAREHIKSGRAKVAIVIPPEYSRARGSGATGEILALVDGADAASSSQAITALEGAIARMNLEVVPESADRASTVTAHSVLLYNPQGTTSTFLLPGLLAVNLAFGYLKMIMRGLTAERAAGTLDRLLMTPLNSTGLILGKVVTYFIIGVCNALVFLLVFRYGFDLPFRGSIPLLILGTMLYILTILSLGAFVAAKVNNMGEANATAVVLLVPSVTLSGFIYPLSSVPDVLLPVAYALPQTHFIEIVRGVCLRGASLSELAPAFVFLAVAPIVLTIGAAIRFSKAISG